MKQDRIFMDDIHRQRAIIQQEFEDKQKLKWRKLEEELRAQLEERDEEIEELNNATSISS